MLNGFLYVQYAEQYLEVCREDLVHDCCDEMILRERGDWPGFDLCQSH